MAGYMSLSSKIPICHSDWVFFQPLKVGFPVKVVMLYICIASSVGMHHVETDKITLLDGGKQVEGCMNGVFFGLKEEKLLLGQQLELNFISHVKHLIYQKRLALKMFLKRSIPKGVHYVLGRRDLVEAVRMSVIPEGMQELESDALFGIERNEDFLQAMSDIDFAHSLEAFIPGVREVAEQCVVFVIVAGNKFLDECLVVSDDCSSEQCLFDAGLAQGDHVAEPTLAALLFDLFAFPFAADNVQGAVTDEVGDFHDGQQIEAVPDIVVYVEESPFGPQPLDGLPFPLPLLQLLS